MGDFDDDFKPDDSNKSYGGNDNNSNNSGGNSGGYGGGGGSYNKGGGGSGGYKKGGYERKEYPPAKMPISVVFYSNKDLPDQAFDKMVTMAKEFHDVGYEIRIPLTWDHAKRFMDAVGFEVFKFGPWKKDFNEIMPDNYVNDSSKDLIKKIHTNLEALADATQAMVCTAPLTLAGKFAGSPSQYLVLYTADGATSKQDIGKETGYSSLTIKMAEILSTRILNLGDNTFNDRYNTIRSNFIKPENYS